MKRKTLPQNGGWIERWCSRSCGRLVGGSRGGTRARSSSMSAATLSAAGSMDVWQSRIQAHGQRDVDAGLLPAVYRPDLQLLDATEQPAPGAQT